MGDASVHELYTAACGLYIIWLVCRVGSVLVSWVPLGWKGVAMKFFEWFLLVSYLYLHCLFRKLGISEEFSMFSLLTNKQFARVLTAALCATQA